MMFVFAYGSLVGAAEGGVAVGAADGHRACTLTGHRRDWDVAMDNRRTIPGYKVYLDPETGERPPVFVTFLNITPTPGARVNGVAFPVDDLTLAQLDRRERNYRRHDVTDLLDTDLGGRVHAYVGTPEGRNRFATGNTNGTAVVARHYLEKVRADFAAAGMLDEFDATTARPPVPVIPLERHVVPEAYSGVT
jgi:cation transport regulator ChaC